jgi:hypothetical protein
MYVLCTVMWITQNKSVMTAQGVWKSG